VEHWGLEATLMRTWPMIVCVAALVGCNSQQRLVVISQSAVNVEMLKRITDAGDSACSADGGLKGVTWAYNTAPKSPLAPPGAIRSKDPYAAIARPVSPAQSSEAEQVWDKMEDLASAAPRPYSTAASDDLNGDPLYAQFICADGAETSSKPLSFVP